MLLAFDYFELFKVLLLDVSINVITEVLGPTDLLAFLIRAAYSFDISDISVY